MNDSEKPSAWEAAYRNRAPGEVKPEKCVSDITTVFRDGNVSKVLDLGCGDGRHLVFLAREGFEMYGVDSAPTALKLAREWLIGEELSAVLEEGDMVNIPWEDGFFDAVICIQVLNHNTADRIGLAFEEVSRVLKDGGLFLGTAMKDPPPPDWWDGDFIEDDFHTYTPLKGHEKGIPHHCFSRDELERYLAGFTTVAIEDESLESPEMHRFAFLANK